MALGTLGQLPSLLYADGHKKTSLVPPRPKVTGEELEPGSHQECLTHYSTHHPETPASESHLCLLGGGPEGYGEKQQKIWAGKWERREMETHREKRAREGRQKINKERRQGGE